MAVMWWSPWTRGIGSSMSDGGVRLGHGAQPGEAPLEVRTDHPVQVEEHAHRLAHGAVVTFHRPGHLRARSRRAEREGRRARGGKRLQELEPDGDALGRIGLRDRHAALPYLAVALPAIRCARAA